MPQTTGSSDVTIGVDVGGTFTDVVCYGPGNAIRVVKIPTTKADPSRAILSAVDFARENWDVPAEAIKRFMHGTTTATNAVLERKGARTGILVTKGFRDILEIGRQLREDMYSVILHPETPVFLASRGLRLEVDERLDAAGKVVTPLDPQSVIDAAERLVAAGVEAIGICFLFSFLDPTHEIEARRIIGESYPHLAVSISSEVDPLFREYERTVVTAFDAYVKPVVNTYLKRLEDNLKAAGVAAPLQIMQSRGGLAAASVVRQRPVRLFLSGPAAGMIGGCEVASGAGIGDIITVDVGGTSCDIAVVENSQPKIRSETQIAGYPVRVSMVDVSTIGSGGGSVAWIDGAGTLKIGPESAGSEPGPACYGRGGDRPAVTDASIVLNYLDPEYFAGGRLRLQPSLSHEAIERHLARPLGVSVEEAALGMHRVVNAQMAEGVRRVSTRQGIDPRGFTLVPLGGAGGIHATALAEDLGMTKILVPRFPGVLAASGLLAAPVEHEASSTFITNISGAEASAIRSVLDRLDTQCRALLAAEQISESNVSVSYYADVCYVGQSFYVQIPFHVNEQDPLGRLYNDFVREHERLYGYSNDGAARIVNLRSSHKAAQPKSALSLAYEPSGGHVERPKRTVRFPGHERMEVSIYQRETLPIGFAFRGGAILEQADTTTLLGPGWTGSVLKTGDILLVHTP
ncbi:hydantoinase/oxoprolinase family protein [Mesorhizobium sp. M0571]|uniref:hydantoinase/oxoprolinase family protein n=1 Tax=Mesorhizobium sp. M0571 TaxID=2956960 RepID=UPI00333985B1